MCALCSGRSGGRGRRVWQLVASLIAAVVLLAAACSSSRPSAPGGPAVIPPATPAGAQFGWLIAVMAHLPMSDAEERTHFDPGYLAMVSPAALNQWLQGLNEWLEAGTGAQLVSIKVDEPSMVVAVVSVFAENRSQPIDPVTAGPVMLGAIKGAFTLAARR